MSIIGKVLMFVFLGLSGYGVHIISGGNEWLCGFVIGFGATVFLGILGPTTL